MANTTYRGKHEAPKKKVPFRRRWSRFWRAVRKNQKYQTVLWLVLLVLVSLVSRGYQYVNDKEAFEAEKAEIIAEHDAVIERMEQERVEEIAAVRAEYEELSPEEVIDQEAIYLAKMLYGNARNNSERDQRTNVWCALNRVDSPGYPNTVQGVCEQASQWMGYSDDNPVLNNLYELAKGELIKWHNGERPCLSDYVYMSWSSKEIVLRDTYEKTADTRYWQSN